MNNLKIDARMALANYESSYAVFGAEASFTMKETHVVRDYIDMLEAALRSIAANTCCEKCQEASLVARAALAGEKKDE